MRTVFTLAALAALQVAAASQVIITEKQDADQVKPVAKVQVAKAPGANANLFYKAYYLESGARKFDEAIEVYKEYLAAAPKGHFAPRSAYSLRQLLNRVGREDEAREVGERYKDVIALRRRGRNMGGRGNAGFGGFGGRGNRGNRDGGAGQRANYAKQLEKLTKDLETTQKSLEGAMASNDQAKIEKLQKKMDKLANQIKVMQRRMERGDNPRRRQGQGRGRRGFGTPLKDMSKEELDTMLERMDGMMERMGQFLDPDRADEVEKKFKEFKKLVKDGKLEEAQKMRDEMFRGMRRRR